MNYKTGLQYLESLPQWAGKGDFSLWGMRQIMDALGNPQDKYNSIHVAGTNGKGSVAVNVASILGSAGMRVGLNTSPHLIQQNERIVIDGEKVSDEFLGECAFSVKRMAQKKKVEPSYFEAITATAFLAFAESRIDWSVIEVGLGGRLDATNVLANPKCCVITSIGRDHTDILGKSDRQIAREKGGIVKEGAIVVVGDLSKDAKIQIREQSKKIRCFELREFGSDFWIDSKGEISKFISDHGSSRVNISIATPLLGTHQLHNASLAMESALRLGFSEHNCQEGVKQVHWPGRIEDIRVGDRSVLFDAAHNVQGMESLVNYLKESGRNKLALLFGVLERPDWKEMLKMVTPFVSSISIIEPQNPRAVNGLEIQEFISGIGISSDLVNDINSFWSKSNQDVLVTGSIYLIGEFRSFLKNTLSVSGLDRPLWQKANR